MTTGFEPGTFGSTDERSTTELYGHGYSVGMVTL